MSSSASFFSSPEMQLHVFEYMSCYADLLAYCHAVGLPLFDYERAAPVASTGAQPSRKRKIISRRSTDCSPGSQHAYFPDGHLLHIFRNLLYSQFSLRQCCAYKSNEHALAYHRELDAIGDLPEKWRTFHTHLVTSRTGSCNECILKRNCLIIFDDNKMHRIPLERDENNALTLATHKQRTYSDSSRHNILFANASNFLLGARTVLTRSLLLVRWTLPPHSFITVLEPHSMELIQNMQAQVCNCFTLVSDSEFIMQCDNQSVQHWKLEQDQCSKPHLIMTRQWTLSSRLWSLMVPIRYANAFAEQQYCIRDDASLRCPLLLSLHHEYIEFWDLGRESPDLASDYASSRPPSLGRIDIRHKNFPRHFTDGNYPVISFTERHLVLVGSQSTDENIEIYSLHFDSGVHTLIHTIEMRRHRFQHHAFPFIQTKYSNVSSKEDEDYVFYEDGMCHVVLFDIGQLKEVHQFEVRNSMFLKRSKTFLASCSFGRGLFCGGGSGAGGYSIMSCDLSTQSGSWQCVEMQFAGEVRHVDSVDEILLVNVRGRVLLYEVCSEAAGESSGSGEFARVEGSVLCDSSSQQSAESDSDSDFAMPLS